MLSSRYLLRHVHCQTFPVPGTRYKRRGVDEEGRCANYVETEQVSHGCHGYVTRHIYRSCVMLVMLLLIHLHVTMAMLLQIHLQMSYVTMVMLPCTDTFTNVL